MGMRAIALRFLRSGSDRLERDRLAAYRRGVGEPFWSGRPALVPRVVRPKPEAKSERPPGSSGSRASASERGHE